VRVQALRFEEELVLELLRELTICLQSTGNSAGRMDCIWPLYMGERWTFSRMMRWVSSVVEAM